MKIKIKQWKITRWLNFYSIVGGLALIWLTFFDQYNLLWQRNTQKKINALKEEVSFYQEEKDKKLSFSESLQHDTAAIEKFARETHGMKKEGEIIFKIIE